MDYKNYFIFAHRKCAQKKIDVPMWNLEMRQKGSRQLKREGMGADWQGPGTRP